MVTKVTRKRLTRAESQAKTRERMVEAARRLVVRQGFGGASIRDIAAEAGYSQGAFYSNFPDKETILLELLRHHMAEEVAQITEVLDTSRSADDTMARLELWAHALDEHIDWSMLAVELLLHANRSSAFAGVYREVWENHRQQLGRLIARLFQQLSRMPPMEPADLAAGFMALAHGFTLQRVVGPSAKGPMIMVFLRGIVASAMVADARLARAKRKK